MKPKTRKILTNLIWITVIIVAGLVVFLNRIAITDEIMAIGYQPSVEIQSLISDIKLTDTGKHILRASRPEIQDADDFNQSCPTETDAATLGCYYKQHIYVYNVTNEELTGIKQAVMAHELLHAAWSRLTQYERDQITPYLKELYAENQEALAKHMEIYTEDTQLDELHSVIGTEIDPTKYPIALRKHYAKYFSNHSTIYSYFSRYHEKFAAIQKHSDELEKQIDAKQKQLDADTVSYNQAYEQLNRDIADFNARANTEGGFASQYEFNTERQKLLLRQDELSASYRNLVSLTNEINDLINEYNQNLVRSTRLYDSIDSRAKNPTIILN